MQHPQELHAARALGPWGLGATNRTWGVTRKSSKLGHYWAYLGSSIFEVQSIFEFRSWAGYGRIIEKNNDNDNEASITGLADGCILLNRSKSNMRSRKLFSSWKLTCCPIRRFCGWKFSSYQTEMCLSKIIRLVLFSVFQNISILYYPLLYLEPNANDIYFAWLTFHVHPFSGSKPSNIRVDRHPRHGRKQAGMAGGIGRRCLSYDLSHHHNGMWDGHGIYGDRSKGPCGWKLQKAKAVHVMLETLAMCFFSRVRESNMFIFAKNGRSRIKEFWSTTIYIYIFTDILYIYYWYLYIYIYIYMYHVYTYILIIYVYMVYNLQDGIDFYKINTAFG